MTVLPPSVGVVSAANGTADGTKIVIIIRQGIPDLFFWLFFKKNRKIPPPQAVTHMTDDASCDRVTR
jgi:hypothetical protein